jgi:hypothetical protein
MNKIDMRPELDNEHVTVRNGYWFYFDDNGLKITAFGSGVSGKEIIYVEDDIVSSKRSIRTSSKHQFTYGNNVYEVELVVTNYWTGELECILSKNGQIISRATKAFYKKGDPQSRRDIKLALFAGIITGAVVAVITFRVLAGLETWK